MTDDLTARSALAALFFNRFLWCTSTIRMDRACLLLFVFFFCLSGYGEMAAAVNNGISSQEAFVFNGLRTLAMAPEKELSSRNQESILYRDVTECKVYCNGKPTKKTTCTGRTDVNCLTLTEGDESLGNQKVEVYKRTCEGRFVNDTTIKDHTFDTTQACHGLTTLTMRLEHKEPENTMWVTDMYFEKSCTTQFVMDVTEYDNPKRKKLSKTQVVTLCDGSAFTAIDNKQSSETAPLIEPAKPTHGKKAIIQCNGKPSEWTRTCRGLFEASEDDEVAKRSTVCDGTWISFGVNFECEGEYIFAREEKVDKGYDTLERSCSGTALISSDDHEQVYQFCNGESKFNEIFTIPEVPVA